MRTNIFEFYSEYLERVVEDYIAKNKLYECGLDSNKIKMLDKLLKDAKENGFQKELVNAVGNVFDNYFGNLYKSLPKEKSDELQKIVEKGKGKELSEFLRTLWNSPEEELNISFSEPEDWDIAEVKKLAENFRDSKNDSEKSEIIKNAKRKISSCSIGGYYRFVYYCGNSFDQSKKEDEELLKIIRRNFF